MRRCFIIDVEDQREFLLDALDSLSDERRERALSYHFEKDRLLSIAAGLFIRYIEDSYDTEIGFNENDKPYAMNGAVEFNISHSGHYTVFAESDLPVGIDIEEIGSHDDIFRNVMTEDEFDVFMKYPAERKDEMFCRMWTVKESYMKAVGSGLTIPPDSFDVVTNYGLRLYDFPDDLMVKELEAPKGYRASICSSDVKGYSLKTITVAEILRMFE